MDRDTLARISKLVAPYRVDDGRRFHLGDIDPGDTGGLGNGAREDAKAWLQQSVNWLAEEQEKLFAQDKWAVLLIFQAMDAAGKDSTIKHVMSGVNPQGCQVSLIYDWLTDPASFDLGREAPPLVDQFLDGLRRPATNVGDERAA